MRIFAVIGISLLCGAGCSVVAPICRAQQHRGEAGKLSGEVGAGQTVMRKVSYATEGSQNDLDITWTHQGLTGGPVLSVYATKVECEEFVAPGTGACAQVGGRGGTASDPQVGFVQRSLIVTHGRGNPERLGSPPEYKLWIVGDPAISVSYAITIRWFEGPDC